MTDDFNPLRAPVHPYEGREEEFSTAVGVVMRTMGDSFPYQHRFNDALAKALVSQVQFAKDQGKLPELVAHELKLMEFILARVKHRVEESGDRELALVAMFERTTCHYQLVAHTEISPGKRVYKSPYGQVLELGVSIGQFDLTEEEIHSVFSVPRILGYAEMIGVGVTVSAWNDDALVTVELMPEAS